MAIRQTGTVARHTNGRTGARTPRPVHYPESDGKPMGETEIHVLALMRLLQILRERFAGRPDVYVGGDLMFYWVEGDPRSSAAPDVFVAIGAPKLPRRRVYKTWEDGVPTVIFEITSKKSRRSDTVTKRELYAGLGVREYFLFDPLSEYLRPSLRGLRLSGTSYQEMEPALDGAFLSEALGLRFRADGEVLRVFDAATGDELFSPDERAAIEHRRAEVEAARAQSEAARADALQREVAELRARLAEQGGDVARE
jgi:Uma2 family endonuclease